MRAWVASLRPFSHSRSLSLWLQSEDLANSSQLWPLPPRAGKERAAPDADAIHIERLKHPSGKQAAGKPKRVFPHSVRAFLQVSVDDDAKDESEDELASDVNPEDEKRMPGLYTAN